MGGGGRLSMLSKLKQAAKKVIETQRYDWNQDLLHGHSQVGDDDIMALTQAAQGQAEADEKDMMTPEQFTDRCSKLKDSITDVLYNYMHTRICGYIHE